MFLNKSIVTVFALGFVLASSMFAAGESQGWGSEQSRLGAEPARESRKQWVARMSGVISPEIRWIHRSPVIQALNETPVVSHDWVERMATTYITPYIKWDDRHRIIAVLNRTPVEVQDWVEKMANMYLTPYMSCDNISMFIQTLSNAPVASHDWAERMVGACIPPEFEETHGHSVVQVLVRVPIIEHRWFEDLMAFLSGRIALDDISFAMQDLVTQSLAFFNTPALLEPMRGRLVAGFNHALEEGPLTRDLFRNITTRVRDEVTQAAQVNAGAAHPMGRAMEVHFAAALQVPLEEEGHPLPLYKAVEARLSQLGLAGEMKLHHAVACLQEWVQKYADEGHQGLYSAVVTKGYGDGLTPGYNQEITPLIKKVVAYMGMWDDTVRSAWLLTALQESATAYDNGDSVSCAKGIQERLTVLGLDVEGVDPVLRSLSKFARDFLYITIPTTNGADNWVKTAVAYLTPEERALLVGAEKPTEEGFRAMFQRAIGVAVRQSDLLPLYAKVLLKNEHIQTALGNSLEMHYDYEKHYEELQKEARSFETPEDSRELMARAAERRLARSAHAGEDDPL